MPDLSYFEVDRLLGYSITVFDLRLLFELLAFNGSGLTRLNVFFFYNGIFLGFKSYLFFGFDIVEDSGTITLVLISCIFDMFANYFGGLPLVLFWAELLRLSLGL